MLHTLRNLGLGANSLLWEPGSNLVRSPIAFESAFVLGRLARVVYRQTGGSTVYGKRWMSSTFAGFVWIQLGHSFHLVLGAEAARPMCILNAQRPFTCQPASGTT